MLVVRTQCAWNFIFSVHENQLRVEFSAYVVDSLGHQIFLFVFPLRTFMSGKPLIYFFDASFRRWIAKKQKSIFVSCYFLESIREKQLPRRS